MAKSLLIFQISKCACFLHGCLLQHVVSSLFLMPCSCCCRVGKARQNSPFAEFGCWGMEGLKAPRSISKGGWAGGHISIGDGRAGRRRRLLCFPCTGVRDRQRSSTGPKQSNPTGGTQMAAATMISITEGDVGEIWWHLGLQVPCCGLQFGKKSCWYSSMWDAMIKETLPSKNVLPKDFQAAWWPGLRALPTATEFIFEQ